MTAEINVTAIREALEQAEGRLGLGAGQVEDVRRLIKELRAELDKLEQEPKPWPQVGDWCWSIDLLGKSGKRYYGNDELDAYLLATGNCHRTETEALAYQEWKTDPRVVARGMIERMDGFDPQGKWVVYSRGGKLKTIYGKDWEQWGVLSFVSINALENAIDAFGEGLFLVAISAITDKEEAGRIVREAMGK